MEQATEIFAAVQCTVIGLSHVTQPRVWAEFFIWLRGKGHVGVFVNGFLCLWFGSVIVAFHNVWEGLPVVLTVLGWSQVVKGLLSFVVPQLGLRSFGFVSLEQPWKFVIGGLFLLGLSAIFWYVALTR